MSDNRYSAQLQQNSLIYFVFPRHVRARLFLSAPQQRNRRASGPGHVTKKALQADPNGFILLWFLFGDCTIAVNRLCEQYDIWLEPKQLWEHREEQLCVFHSWCCINGALK